MLQVVVGADNRKQFCPMILLMLLALAADMQDLIREAKQDAAQERFCQGLLEKPTLHVSF